MKDKKGSENSIADHLSRILTECIDDSVGFSNHFLDEQLFSVSHTPLPWFTDIVNHLATRKIPPHWSKQEKDKILLLGRSLSFQTLP